MGVRLIIDGNAVYEIDEDCQICGGKKDRETKAPENSVSKGKEEQKEKEKNL